MSTTDSELGWERVSKRKQASKWKAKQPKIVGVWSDVQPQCSERHEKEKKEVVVGDLRIEDSSEVKLDHGLEMNSNFCVTGMSLTSQAGEASFSTSPVSGAGATVVASSENSYNPIVGDPGEPTG
ncbi:hypothetical protein U1Q18_017911 [Sarracenia purpurea var. burkii]